VNPNVADPVKVTGPLKVIVLFTPLSFLVVMFAPILIVGAVYVIELPVVPDEYVVETVSVCAIDPLAETVKVCK
jgi:hypothetical protein